ncbi:MAG: ABC transporter permease, partial [Gaiellaceae bacterium]
MRKVVVRGFFSRKLRAVLTGLAIALGVCLMAGTYVLTDTIDRSFANIFDTATKGIDVAVTPHKAIKNASDSSLPPIPESTLERVKQVPGVKLAAGTIFGQGAILDARGKRVGSGGGPTFVASVDPVQFEAFKAGDGRLPRREGEVALDASTAKNKHVGIGDGISIVGRGPAQRFRVVGLVKFGGSESFGASAALLTLPDAQRVTGEAGAFDEIDVAADTGVTPEALRDRVRAVLPRELDVRTGQQQADKQTSDIHDQLGFLRTFLLVFAGIALLVATFSINNTFSIIAAQRQRTAALLRAVG